MTLRMYSLYVICLHSCSLLSFTLLLLWSIFSMYIFDSFDSSFSSFPDSRIMMMEISAMSLCSKMFVPKSLDYRFFIFFRIFSFSSFFSNSASHQRFVSFQVFVFPLVPLFLLWQKMKTSFWMFNLPLCLTLH